VRILLHFRSYLNRLQLRKQRSSSGTDFSLCFSSPCLASTAAFILVIAAACGSLCVAQTSEKNAPPSAQKEATASPSSKPAETEKNPAQIELLETKYRFETNGDSRKEVHAQVRINNELGVRQFARLNFDFNRSFQSVEIPLVRITHASGGIADILPSAITDNPNPAVVDFPAYHDVRVKSVRILGLEPNDLLEYRVVTTTTHHPLAPDFWLDHTFDRTGVVSQEIFELDLPVSLNIKPKINPETRPETLSPSAQAKNARAVYQWRRKASARTSEKAETTGPDVSLSTFKSWKQLGDKLAKFLFPARDEVLAMREKAFKISEGIVDGETGQFYEFVSQKIRTVDLPLGATGYRRRNPMEILESGYASAEDKFALFATLGGITKAGFVSDSARPPDGEVPSPARFNYLLTFGYQVGLSHWLDLNSEVAPEGMIPPQFRDKPVFVFEWSIAKPFRSEWQTVEYTPIFLQSQQVKVSAGLDAEGGLTAKVHYNLRGDNELLLRVAFHQTPKEKWKDVAQLLAISDGFRGTITNVTASDPYATHEAFSVEYEISQPQFVDWSKKTVRIPALLPLPGLPEAEPAATGNSAKKSIDLGTPLDIDLEATLQLPIGSTAQAPTGTSVERDYATFSSKYSVEGNTLHATRKLHFILREIPAARAADWNAFLHAVQSDQTQLFTLQPPATK
jgi:hypothetical protein